MQPIWLKASKHLECVWCVGQHRNRLPSWCVTDPNRWKRSLRSELSACWAPPAGPWFGSAPSPRASSDPPSFYPPDGSWAQTSSCGGPGGAWAAIRVSEGVSRFCRERTLVRTNRNQQEAVFIVQSLQLNYWLHKTLKSMKTWLAKRDRNVASGWKWNRFTKFDI